MDKILHFNVVNFRSGGSIIYSWEETNEMMIKCKRCGKYFELNVKNHLFYKEGLTDWWNEHVLKVFQLSNQFCPSCRFFTNFKSAKDEEIHIPEDILRDEIFWNHFIKVPPVDIKFLLEIRRLNKTYKVSVETARKRGVEDGYLETILKGKFLCLKKIKCSPFFCDESYKILLNPPGKITTGKVSYFGAKQGKIWHVNLQTNKISSEPPVHSLEKSLIPMCQIKDDSYAFFDNGAVYMFRDGKRRKIFESKKGTIKTLLISQDSSSMLVHTDGYSFLKEEEDLEFFEYENDRIVPYLKKGDEDFEKLGGKNSKKTFLNAVFEGRNVITIDHSGEVLLWENSKKPKKLFSIPGTCISEEYELVVLPGRRLLYFNRIATIFIGHIDTKKIDQIRLPNILSSTLLALSFAGSPDEKYLAISVHTKLNDKYNNTIWLYGIVDGGWKKLDDIESVFSFDLSFLPNGPLVAFGDIPAKPLEPVKNYAKFKIQIYDKHGNKKNLWEFKSKLSPKKLRDKKLRENTGLSGKYKIEKFESKAYYKSFSSDYYYKKNEVYFWNNSIVVISNENNKGTIRVFKQLTYDQALASAKEVWEDCQV